MILVSAVIAVSVGAAAVTPSARRDVEPPAIMAQGAKLPGEKLLPTGQICPTGAFTALSAYHVFDTGLTGQWLDDGKGVVHELRIGTRWDKKDLVTVLSTEPFPVWFELGDEPYVGEPIEFWGRDTFSTWWYVYKGYVSGFIRDTSGTQAMLLSAYGHQGVSGGCVFDHTGRVIGIMVGAVVARQADGLAEPMGKAVSVYKGVK